MFNFQFKKNKKIKVTLATVPNTFQKRRGGDRGRSGAKNNFPPCSTVGVINSPVLTHAGHSLWLQALPSVPPYLVPNSDGHLDSPILSGFYMFFTMIILLQVEDWPSIWKVFSVFPDFLKSSTPFSSLSTISSPLSSRLLMFSIIPLLTRITSFYFPSLITSFLSLFSVFPFSLLPFRSWFPSPSTCPLSWWRLVRSSSSRMTSICTMRRQTAASSVRPWTSQRTWDRSNTSSQTRLAPSLRTRWCFADAPSWAPSTHTRRMVILHTAILFTKMSCCSIFHCHVFIHTYDNQLSASSSKNFPHGMAQSQRSPENESLPTGQNFQLCNTSIYLFIYLNSLELQGPCSLINISINVPV